MGSRLSNAWNNAHSGYYAGTNHFDLNQIGMPQQQDFSSGYNPALNPGFTNFNQPGLQTIAQQPFKTVDPTLYGPLLDVHVDGDGRGGGDGGGNSAASGASVGLTYNKLMGGGARAGWGTTRGPNYS